MYATQNDIVELYGSDALFVADRDGDGVPDAAAVEQALSSASDEIDSFLAVRYPVPLSDPAPAVIRQYAIDIALYRLASSSDVMSEELRKRYEDAVAALRRIAKGEQALVLVSPEGEATEDTSPPANCQRWA